MVDAQKAAPAAKPTIVAAVGSTSLGPGLGAEIEAAMSKAHLDAEVEAKKIWEDASLKIEDKRAQIAKIMHPDAIRARKLAARKAVKDNRRKLADLAAKKATETAAAAAATKAPAAKA